MQQADGTSGEQEDTLIVTHSIERETTNHPVLRLLKSPLGTQLIVD
jgi:hypothetical protein